MYIRVYYLSNLLTKNISNPTGQYRTVPYKKKPKKSIFAGYPRAPRIFLVAATMTMMAQPDGVHPADNLNITKQTNYQKMLYSSSYITTL